MPDTPKLADGSGPIPSTEDALARIDETMVEAMMTQRAIRRLRPDPVDDALVLRCIELALRAPTGSNGQNWEFIVVKDPAVKRKLAKRYRQGWDLYYRSSVRKIAETDESMAKTARAVQWQVDHFAEIPVMVVACLRMSVKEGKIPYLPMPHAVLSGFFGSIYPSVQNILLVARSMGLGASLITLPLWSQASARRALGLPTSVTPVCIVPMGWPRGRYGSTTRRPVGEVVHLDRFGNRAWL
jgi:nitroreductase